MTTNRVSYAIVRSARLSARAWGRANASSKCTSATLAVRAGLVALRGYETVDQGRCRCGNTGSMGWAVRSLSRLPSNLRGQVRSRRWDSGPLLRSKMRDMRHVVHVPSRDQWRQSNAGRVCSLYVHTQRRRAEPKVDFIVGIMDRRACSRPGPGRRPCGTRAVARLGRGGDRSGPGCSGAAFADNADIPCVRYARNGQNGHRCARLA